jgi:hypothetical protein
MDRREEDPEYTVGRRTGRELLARPLLRKNSEGGKWQSLPEMGDNVVVSGVDLMQIVVGHLLRIAELTKDKGDESRTFCRGKKENVIEEVKNYVVAIRQARAVLRQQRRPPRLDVGCG